MEVEFTPTLSAQDRWYCFLRTANSGCWRLRVSFALMLHLRPQYFLCRPDNWASQMTQVRSPIIASNQGGDHEPGLLAQRPAHFVAHPRPVHSVSA
jgi:hypothetical protein